MNPITIAKNLSLFFCFLISTSITVAQSFNNDWIDYNKTYYKFKVGPFGYDNDGAPIEKGVVRINGTALAAAGLANVTAEQFQLWKDGKEVPIFISKSSGTLSSSDYIEFWGEIANGNTDTQLYNDSSFQLSTHWSLESDSAAYFLTVNPSGNNKRLQQINNDVNSINIFPEKNFIYTVGKYYRNELSQGFGVLDQSLFLSAYDNGEGFTSRAVRNNNNLYGQGQLTQLFSHLYPDTSIALMTARFSMTGNASYDRNVRILLNNEMISEYPMGYFLSAKPEINISADAIKNDSATFIIQNLSAANDDKLRVATIELDYPRLFNFGGATSFEFYINACDKGRYLKIANFNKANGEAVLYDITNGKRYVANTSIQDTLQFLLQPSSEKYHLVLVRANGSTATIINSLQPRHFTDFSKQINQGDYLIISNPVLFGSGSNNYIEQYKDYRSSDSGGHFNAKIVDIHDLEDQFAYGINMHPLAIKNFLRFARLTFSIPPAYVFLIGKGISYPQYRFAESNTLTKQLNLIPVFGNPGSDNLLSSDNQSDVPATPIGRLSVVSPEEIGVYLKKIKQYESNQRDTSNTIKEKSWMKKVLQLSGQNDASIRYSIQSFQAKYSKIISDTLLGANVTTFNKTDDATNYAQSLTQFRNEYDSGSAMVEYLGHASTSSIDFNLDNPDNYANKGKYPVFMVNGCLSGNIFDYDVNRLNDKSTLSEKFILAQERGAIGYLSSSSYAVLSYIDLFTQQIYTCMTSKDYGSGFGKIIQDGINNVLNYTGNSDFYSRMHAEQLVLNGDPALKINAFPLPDFAIDSTEVIATPGYLTAASDSFNLKIKIHNLGKAINDSVHFYLLRKFPDGNSDTAFYKKIPAPKNLDSIEMKLPVVSNRDKGTTTIVAMIDDDNAIAEASEKNNIASVKIKIGAADPVPVFPYNYAIVNSDSVDLSASVTFDSLTQYAAEVDTTALFNSPLKVKQTKLSKGGLITFSKIPLQLNNTVYYWRVSKDSANKHWNGFSFIHKESGGQGFEQAHFYQHTQSSFNGIGIDSLTRVFDFSKALDNVYIQHAVYPTSGTGDAQFSISLNGSIATWSACVGSSIIFNIFDPNTFKPILDSTQPYNAGSICDSMRRYNFEYSTQSAASRKNAMDFLDNYVPNGYYVVARKIYDLGNTDWAPTVWAKDTALYGHNNSLYHRLKDQGVAIDSFTHPRTFIFMFKKNDAAHYQPVSVLSKGLYDRILNSQNISVFDTVGTATSPLFGPAKSWNKATWNGVAQNNNNITSLDILTIDKNGKDSLWYNLTPSQQEINISSINAANYPYIKLRMHTKDALTFNPYQLQNWSVESAPVPEGAIAANLGVDIPDSINFYHNIHVAFDTLKGYVVFKNISNASFDPLKIKLILFDKNNNAYNFLLPKTSALSPGDTLHVSFLINVTDLPEGKYNLYLEVNPDEDQPEQYHYNNTFYQYVKIVRSIMLAARLVDFTAKPLNNNAQLQWVVNNEMNVDKYSVEYSKDGRVFITVGSVAATAIHAIEKNYGFVHTGVANGKNYYRIKMVDKDGKYIYSQIRMVIFDNNKISVYPNPFHQYLDITTNNNETSTAELLDAAGKLLLRKIFTNRTLLQINNIAEGVYIVRINDGESIRSFKVLKK